MKAKDKKRSSLEKKLARQGYLFLMPWFVGLAVFVVYPLIASLVYVFNKFDITATGFDMTFIGLDNIKYAFYTDPDFVKKMVETLSTLAWQIPMILIFSTFFGVILNQKFRGRFIARTLMFFPVIVASGLVMNIINGDFMAQALINGQKSSSMYNVNIIQDFLLGSGIGLGMVESLISLSASIFSIAWKSGVQILLILAALQGIPVTLYEAAAIEGSTAWETFWKITIPNISPILLVNVVFTIVDSFIDVSSPVMSHIAAQQHQLWLEYSVTLTWIYTLIVFTVLGIVFAIFGRKIKNTF